MMPCQAGAHYRRQLVTADELTDFSRRGLRLVDIDEHLTWLQRHYLDPAD